MPRAVFVVLTLFRAASATGSSAASIPLIDLRKVHAPYTNYHQIKVPLHTRLLDAIEDVDRPRCRGKRRHYEIETLDESSSIATLNVQEVSRMAVTPQTTYNFNRDLDPKALHFSILADHSKDHITIISLNRSSGRVRGLHRENGGRASHISNKDSNRLYMRSLGGVTDRKEWACGALHHKHTEKRSINENSTLSEDESSGVPGAPAAARITDSRRRNPTDAATTWKEPQKYSFHIDISIEIDSKFIENQGGAENAVEYVNFLVSASNLVFEHEVDAHLNVVHIEETDRFDSQTSAKEALSMMRMQLKSNSTNYSDSRSKFRLHHAVLGRYLGGGIAFIDSVCDDDWGFGVTSDMSGNLENVDDNVLFDYFIFIHELGHSLGSGHTFDEDYNPPIDECAPCAMPGNNATVYGLPHHNSGTIMSYCNFCDGGLSNIALTLGGEWKGLEPKGQLATWSNSPSIEGSVSNEARRVPHLIWETLSSKGLECVKPPVQFKEIQGCTDDAQCDDNNECSVDACIDNFCSIAESIPHCCGNQICEVGELGNECLDCGPFFIEPPGYCKECFALNGFMIELTLHEMSDRDIFINSISFMHATPTTADATITLYSALGGSYQGNEASNSSWEILSTAILSSQSTSNFTKIALNPPLALSVGCTKAFYLFASQDILLFGQGAYSIKNDHGLELYSSRSVNGFFGDSINGFSLSCSIEYSLNDSVSTPAPTKGPSMHPLESMIQKYPKESTYEGRDSLSSQPYDEEQSEGSQDMHIASVSFKQQFYYLSVIGFTLIWLIFY